MTNVLTALITLLSTFVLLPSSDHSQSAQEKREAVDLPAAFITSKRVVYPFGAEIDLTFSITTPKEGQVLPHFKIENEDGEIVEAREVNGLHLWESPGKSIDGKQREGALPAGVGHTETLEDLRAWYEVDAPGNYRITFAGEWIDPEDEAHSLTSNTLIIRIARPPSEDEPFGEPTAGRVIPLSEIWALDMPGTKPMNPTRRAVDRVFNAPEGELVNDIVLLHMTSVEMRLPARDGFIVRGTGIEALRQVHAILVDNQQPETVFQRGEHVTLVFFSKAFGAYVHLDRVEDHGSVIKVSYKLVTHRSDDATSHLALIPLRLDHVGAVQVEMKPIIPELLMKRADTGRHMRTHMAQSFQFTVAKQGKMIGKTNEY